MKLVLLALTFVFVSCNGCSDKKHSSGQSFEDLQKDLVESNKKKHLAETETIHAYIQKKAWPMTETKTGLNYWVYEKGNGALAKEGDFVVMAYTVELLDGKVCYSAGAQNPGKFLIGQDNVETGLHEAIQLLHVGDKAKLILPSHLAFGFSGDSNQVPQNASLVYDVQLLAIE